MKNVPDSKFIWCKNVLQSSICVGFSNQYRIPFPLKFDWIHNHFKPYYSVICHCSNYWLSAHIYFQDLFMFIYNWSTNAHIPPKTIDLLWWSFISLQLLVLAKIPLGWIMMCLILCFEESTIRSRNILNWLHIWLHSDKANFEKIYNSTLA